MWKQAGLIGDSGFVGGELARQIPFARTYNSRTIERIAGEAFDVLVCSGAPATMWAANANPDADKANLRKLAADMAKARIGKLILISSIAVLDDTAAGYTESHAAYEREKAYGRHRRELEEHVLEHYDALVVRLPALFGRGLKKNFIFDLMHPVPSFVKPDKFEQLAARFAPHTLQLLQQVFSFDAALAMHKLDRAALDASGRRGELQQAFEHAGFLARNFTNSESRYQYYGLANLRRDLETALAARLSTLNICSEPWQVGELHEALTGTSFSNTAPPRVVEDVHTEHAAAFGRSGPYLYDRAQVLDELRAFMKGQNA